MNRVSSRQLVIEFQQVKTVRRRIATIFGHCPECRASGDLVLLDELARLFEVSVAGAILQLRRRRIHLMHLSSGTLAVCIDSLLTHSDPDQAMLIKSSPPLSDCPGFTVSSDS